MSHYDPQRVALVKASSPRTRPSSRGSVVSVIDDRPRADPDVMPPDPKLPTEGEVLVVGEQGLVETARFQEKVTPHQHGGATGEESRPLLVPGVQLC